MSQQSSDPRLYEATIRAASAKRMRADAAAKTRSLQDLVDQGGPCLREEGQLLVDVFREGAEELITRFEQGY